MRQPIFYLILLITFLLCNANALLAESVSQSHDIENPVHAARDSILSYFYPAKGIVAGVENGYVKVNLEAERELKEGMRLSAFREGVPFYHPITKELMGKTENFTGRIEIVRKETDGSYICSKISGDIAEGDLVRITSSKVKLTFFQDSKSDWKLSDVFYNSLKDSQRFEILESYTRSYEPEILSKLAKGLGAEAVLMFSTSSKDGKKFLNVKLYWTEDSKFLTEIDKAISPDLTNALTSDEEIISIGPTDTEPWGSYNLAAGELIAIGDVDGSGQKRLVVSDGTNIRIYSLTDGHREIWFIKGKPHEKHLSIDILDLNRDGRAEIFVTSMTGRSSTAAADETSMKPADYGSISSFIIEYHLSEGYKRISDGLPYFLRVVKDKLLMQKFTAYEIFTDSVYEGQWKDGHYLPFKPLMLPENVNIYGFTFIDWQNSGDTQLMAFDDEGHLNLYKAGELIWRSTKSYGKFYFSFEEKTHSIANPIKKWHIKGRLIPIRTKSGQEVIVVKKIPLLSNVPGLGASGAEVYSLWWDGDVMEEKLIMHKIAGTITDYWVEGKELSLIAKGNVFTFIKKAVTGDFSSGSKLYYYNFSEE